MSTEDATADQRAASLREGAHVRPEEAVIGCRDVTKTFGSITAVDDVTIGIDSGEWVSIVGPNGAGKTTLLNILNGFYSPDPGGVVYLNGEDVTGRPSHYRARQGLARTFQGLELFEEENVLENVMTVRAVHERPNLLSALLFYGRGRQVEARNMRRVEEILDYLELWEHRHATVSALPLGVQRRVDLARSLALEPDVLLLDEAMSGLTFDEKYDMIRFLTDLHEEEGMTLVMIEHDLEVVTAVSDRMIVMQKGGVIARGPPEAVTEDPEVARVYTGVD
ncbi:ABC transporter ATP-binding protein [Halolamina sediminis]|jgi:branched-chain amino acid transport system ATP-binding protein|uniref:ABC transporter ATP-binding protein n=1 Tax=Halolamina sediminis TaxID=1480675 RepID=UPI0009AD2B87|nr:ABC transporter ATP-binding protein [Halolamina sediminis]